MAAGQRDISVSEFFAKNRHLLGFDNPRKALLTTVKEAVDNSLDACEEAGILPEIWVHIEATDAIASKSASRTTARHRQSADSKHLRQVAIRFEVSSAADEPRSTGDRHQRGGYVRRAHHRQAVKVMSRITPKKPAHYFEIQIDTKKNRAEVLNGKGEGIDLDTDDAKLMEKLGIEWTEVDHGTRVTIELEAKYQRGRGSVDDYLAQTAIANPHVTIHYKILTATCSTFHARPKSCRPSRRRFCRIPTASSWATWSR